MIVIYQQPMRFFLISILTIASFSSAFASDESKEKRFHEIYKKYNSNQTSETDWEKVIGNRKSQIYKIQKGDTLWEVSKTFFGDPHYWSKIWGLNASNIYNPHVIDPTLQIGFYPGTVLDAPTLKLTKDTKEKVGTLAEKSLGSDGNSKSNTNPNEILNEGKIPNSKRRIVPIVQELPKSLPVIGYTVRKLEVPPNFKVRPIVRSQSANLDLPQFVTDKMPPSIGEVIGTEMELKSASDFQYIFIKSQESLIGKPLVAIQNVGKLKSADSWGSSILAEVQGELEVKEVANPDKGIYRALVKRTVNPVQVGAQVILGVIPKFNTGLGGVSKKSVSAQLMGSSAQDGHEMYGTSNLVFINAGTSKGISEGDVFAIYPKDDNHYEKLPIKSDRPSGLVRIVKVEDSVSTGYMIKSVREIIPGDWVGTVGISTQRAKGVEENEEVQSAKAEEPEETFTNEAPANAPENKNDTELDSEPLLDPATDDAEVM